MHSALDLALAEETWGETEHELRKRVALLIERGIFSRSVATQLLDEVLATIGARVSVLPADIYANRLDEARQRIPRDRHDAPVIALTFYSASSPSQ